LSKEWGKAFPEFIPLTVPFATTCQWRALNHGFKDRVEIALVPVSLDSSLILSHPKAATCNWVRPTKSLGGKAAGARKKLFAPAALPSRNRPASSPKERGTVGIYDS
jgi:hypothetical protein